MKTIVLNEYVYAYKYLHEDFYENKPYLTLAILAKYYYHKEGFRKKKIEKLLNEYAEKHSRDYSENKSHWQEYIERLSRDAGKKPLYEINGVRITKTEMEKIDSIEDERMRRVIFTFLCLAKLGIARNPKKNGWVSDKSQDIFKLAHVSASINEQNVMIGKLYKMGFLEFAERNDNLSCRVTFIDEASNEVIFVSDFRELGLEYMNYKHGGYIRCADCDRLFKQTHGLKRYCKECSAWYVPQEMKTVTCSECGKEFVVSSKNNKTYRCSECQHLATLEQKRAYWNKVHQN